MLAESPLTREMAPEASAALLPVERLKDPVTPVEAAPVEIFTGPDAAASGVAKNNKPLDPVLESPLEIETLPPD